jgi:hypothetical protein
MNNCSLKTCTVIYGDSMSANESFSNREIYHIRGELELEDDEPQKP